MGDQRVARSAEGGQRWTRIGTDGDGLGADIAALVQHTSGRVWAGADEGGISVFAGARWRHVQQP